MINKTILNFINLCLILLQCLIITSCSFSDQNINKKNEAEKNKYIKNEHNDVNKEEVDNLLEYPNVNFTLYDMTMMLGKNLGNEHKIYNNENGEYSVLGTTISIITNSSDFNEVNGKIELITGGDYNYHTITMIDKSKENLINDLIYNNLLLPKVLESHKVEEKITYLTSGLKFAEKNYISFKSAVSEEFYGGSRVSIVEYHGGITIDIKNAKILRLNDIIIDLDELINDMRNKKNFCWYVDLMQDTPKIPPQEGTEFFKSVHNEHIKLLIENIKNDVDVRSLNGIDTVNHHSIFFIHETGIYIATNITNGATSNGRWMFIPMENLKEHLSINLY